MKCSEPKTFIVKVRPHFLPVALLLVGTLAVYLRIIGHDFIPNWDDSFYVVDNEAAHGFTLEHIRTVFSTSFVGNYAPLQMLSYMSDYEIWGLWAGGFLLTNITIHFLNGVLVYRLFLKLLGGRFAAFVGAAIFLLHPVQVESVAWVSQRKNLLAMLFFLLSWLWYMQYRGLEGRKKVTAYAVSLAAYVLALLSKSVVVVFPIVLVRYDYVFNPAIRRNRFKDKIPYAVAAGAVAILALRTQSPYEGGGRELEYHGGSLLATFYTMLPVFCRYLGMLIWPANLSAGYAPQIYSSPDLPVCLAGLFLGVMLIIGIRLYVSDRGSGFWVAYFVLALLPVSQIVPLSTLINDRYLYFPIIGAAALCALGTAKLNDSVTRYSRLPGYAVPALCLVMMAVSSFQRAGVWRSAVSLWNDAAVKSPESPHIWERLGEAYHFSTPVMAKHALRAYTRALELTPPDDVSLRDVILYNTGMLCNASGEYMTGHKALIRLLEGNPDHVMGWVALGDNLQKSGLLLEAETAYIQAYDLQPEAVEVQRSLTRLRENPGFGKLKVLRRDEKSD